MQPGLGIACEDRKRLTDELMDAVSAIAVLSGEQIRAVIEGRVDDKLREEIEKVQLEKMDVWLRLQAHIQEHQCT